MNDVSTELIFEPDHITKETIKKYLCPLATDQELMMGLQIAKTFKLNPLKRELYFIKYSEKDKMSVVTGYEVYLKRAERSGKYGGLRSWTEGSLSEGNLKGCVEISRKDWLKPLYHEADYTEYIQMKGIYEKKGESRVKVGEEANTFWKNKPKTMIKKVAESQGFRKAFPDEFDGMPYTSDEVIDQERIIDIQSPAGIAKNSPTLTQAEPKDMELEQLRADDPERVLLAVEGKVLLDYMKERGYDKEHLKQWIKWEYELDSILGIRLKHLEPLRKHFEKPNPEAQK